MMSLLALAKAKMQQNDDVQVELSVQKIINTYPDKHVSPTAELELAKYYRNKGNLKKSKIIFQRILKTYPQSPEAEEADALLNEATP